MTEVNLNHVGIILGFQVSRLSAPIPTGTISWSGAPIFHTLLADMDGVYDPTLYNDRLLLGLKGTMSEAELHFLRQRLYQGRLNKARRGEQFTSAPIGYVRSSSGNRLELDPDEQVQHVVRLIFDKFDELGSVGAVLRYLVRHDIKLGIRLPSGPDAGQLQWRPAFRPTLNRILQPSLLRRMLCIRVHPTGSAAEEAGPAQFRHRPGATAEVGGDDPGKVPAYITWERYLANQQRLASNRCLPTTPACLAAARRS